MGEEVDQREGAAGGEWTPEEVRLIVADYFDMLRLELARQPYNKTEHRQALMRLMPSRSRGSVEFKHQNISAVLIENRQPYIDGYKPRANYQRLLATSVDDYLAAHPQIIQDAFHSPRLDAVAVPALPAIPEAFEPPPDQIIVPDARPRDWRELRGHRVDFARRDADNRRLGTLGEQFVLDLERRRLTDVRRDDLAARVQWIAGDFGDGAGFDVLSFDEQDESERKIEVKTTGLGKFFPFYVTATEVNCSVQAQQQYHLYRVFDFALRPRVYVLRGALPDVCRLTPSQYQAGL